MEDIIRSEDICSLIVGALKIIDNNIMGHNCRTAFILYTMLMSSDKYEDFELAELTFVATLHDIGAYKVEQGVDVLKYEYEHPLPHSIYGYLFMKNVSPYEHLSKIILYSHVDHKNLVNIDFKYKNVANMLNLAGMIDHFRIVKGNKFSPNDLRRHIGTKFSEEAFNLLDIATRKYDLFQKLDSGEYLDILYEALSEVMFSDEDKEKMMEFLVYVMSFAEEKYAKEAILCMDIAEQLRKKLEGGTDEDIQKLHYAGLLHDIGMTKVPKELQNVRNFGEEEEFEARRFCRHLDMADDLLRDRIDSEVCDIIIHHHERIDGSGFPRKLTGPDLKMNDKILQVAETAAYIACSGENGKLKPAATIAAILTDEMNHNKFQRKIVMTFCNDKENIMKHAIEKLGSIMADFNKLNVQYEQLSKAMGVKA